MLNLLRKVLYYPRPAPKAFGRRCLTPWRLRRVASALAERWNRRPRNTLKFNARGLPLQGIEGCERAKDDFSE